jgi:moderate conductance mechanosensitive channel
MENLGSQIWAQITGRQSGVVNSLIILLLTWLALTLIRQLQRQVLRRIDQAEDPAQADSGRKARLKTITGVCIYAIRVLVIAVALICLLSAIGVNVAPLITSLGVAGLALSLGAQTLIKDYIFGLIILIENQYFVGETVTIGNNTGEVERITMRATWLRTEKGLLTVIPHGDVRTITNASRDWGLADVSYELPLENDLPGAIRALEDASRQAVEQEVFKDALLTSPVVQGWSSSENSKVKLRVSVRTRVEQRKAVEKALQEFGTRALEQAGFTFNQ